MISYTLGVSQPQARRAEVSLEVDTKGETSLDVRLPVWTPGSYLVREHQRHVDGFAASDDSGRELPFEKIDKQTWRIRADGSRRVRVSYRVGCFELTVRTNHVDPTHAFLNPAGTCAYVVGREGEPCSVRTALPAGWQTWVALPTSHGVYEAEDYDELVDSPFEMGPESSHSVHTFTAQGVPHQLVVWGKGDFDARRAVPDMAKIVDALASIFGGLPFRDRYLFILHLNDRGRGGLEHRRSCALLVPRFAFVQKAAYEDFLQLVAHEYFHLWNVKRIRPQAFTPYDWTRENHTRLLWAMEGLTSFYEIVALRRAGLITPERFVGIWAERITQLWRTPGRLRTPLALASFDSWIKHYRPDESTANTTVSYYLKGSVVGFLLDLEIRRRTAGARSLDDVMRLLFERYGRPPGLPEEGVEKTASEVAGEDLRPWFDRALRSTEELDVEGALAGVGLQAIFRPASGPEDKGGAAAAPPESPDAAPRAALGALLREKGASLEVAGVLEGSPAQEAGIAAGDEIVALDGFRSDMQKRLSRGQPGQEVAVALFRMDELLTVNVRLSAAPRDTATIVPNPRAAPGANDLRTAWLGASWP